MFSDKIVCAIRVMNLLAYSPPGQRSARGIDAGFLKELLGVEYSLYKSVINTLIIGNICYTTARMVYLGKGVERVTVYDLMYLFHKGLPMGAATEIDWNKGDYLHDRHYARLRHLEEHARAGTAPPGSGKHVRGRNGPQTGRLPRRNDPRPDSGTRGQPTAGTLLKKIHSINKQYVSLKVPKFTKPQSYEEEFYPWISRNKHAVLCILRNGSRRREKPRRRRGRGHPHHSHDQILRKPPFTYLTTPTYWNRSYRSRSKTSMQKK